MLTRRSASDAAARGDGVGSERRRGLGPFTGRQLTTIICVLTVAIVAPIGAWAVTGSNVFVTDPISGAQAKVDSAGAVQSKAVLGSMAVPHVTPAWSYHSSMHFAFEDCTNVTAEVPSNKALVVTSITVKNVVATTGPIQIRVATGTFDEPCTVWTFLGRGVVEADGLTTISFPSGLVVGPGHTLDLSMDSPSDDNLSEVYVDGYWVPSAQCSVSWGYGGSPVGCV
jgi:hypothetical protein